MVAKSWPWHRARQAPERRARRHSEFTSNGTAVLYQRWPHLYSSSLFMGTLYYGDNLEILSRHLAAESVDLVYLDPPFNSAQSYNAFFQEKDGTPRLDGLKWWALGLVGARGMEERKGADGGIDGKILFRDDPKSTKPEQIIFSVKGGKLKADDVRALGHVVARENAAIGVLIAFHEPTAGMRADAGNAGFYTHKLNGLQYPKLQLLTVAELLDGRTIARPSHIAAGDETFKKAPKAKAKSGEQPGLGL